MKVKLVFLASLVLLLLFSMALPAALGSMAMQPAIPVVQAGHYSPFVSAVWSVNCGFPSTFGTVRPSIACPNVSWNS